MSAIVGKKDDEGVVCQAVGVEIIQDPSHRLIEAFNQARVIVIVVAHARGEAAVFRGKIRAGLDRMALFQGSIEKAAREHGGGGFDGYNLSDIFEYLAPNICQTIYQTLLDHSRPKARVAYWNMLVPRKCPEQLADHVTHLKAQSNELLQRDLAFFYSAFVVEEVR